MYKDLGKLGNITIQSIRYQEDIVEEKKSGYKYGFDIELLPRLNIGNHCYSYRIEFSWLMWSAIYWNWKWWQWEKQRKDKCCGDCLFFKYECVDGDGVCEINDCMMFCNDGNECDKWKERDNYE